MNWLRRVMLGRYGSDQLSIALMILYMVLSLLSRFTNVYVLSVISLIPLVFCFFRMFSKNIQKRYQENNIFMGYYNKVKYGFYNKRDRIRDMKIYKYYKCPNCSNKLRVPRGKGKICITCPSCKTKFIKRT